MPTMGVRKKNHHRFRGVSSDKGIRTIAGLIGSSLDEYQRIVERIIMDRFRKKGTWIKRLSLWLIVFLVGQSTVALAGVDRIYPTGKATLWRGGRQIGVYTQEAPLPEGAIISTEGQCAIKLDDSYLVAEDQSVLSISTTGRQRNLFIKQGIVYFKTSGIKHALTFVTPNGLISVEQIRLHSEFGDAALKGYVSVTEKQSELGVAEGGIMDVLTDEGLKTIEAGKKIILAQADMDIGLPEEEQPPVEKPVEQKKPYWTTKKIAIGALGAAAIIGIAVGLGGGGGDDDVSPSSP